MVTMKGYSCDSPGSVLIENLSDTRDCRLFVVHFTGSHKSRAGVGLFVANCFSLLYTGHYEMSSYVTVAFLLYL